MAQPFCSYEDLFHIVPILTADSSTPVSIEKLNPLIERFLLECPASIQAFGGHSALLSTPDGIVAKVSFEAGDRRLRTEQDVISLLQESPSPYIVPCFLLRPDIAFMPFVSSRNLYDRVTMGDSCPVLSWMTQLSSAVTALETLGLAHGDIKPANILIDENDQLTLIDLDHALPLGSDLDVGDDPYVRAHSVGETEGGGVYGRAGPKTEPFALGSIFWYIARGEELFAGLDGVERVNRMSDRRFPDLEPGNPVDYVIGDCWAGRFERVADLLSEIQRLDAGNGMLIGPHVLDFHIVLCTLPEGSCASVTIPYYSR